jgi:Bacterial membrane protein YfhO
VTRRDLIALLILSVLPVIALAPGWWEGRLLGPGDGAMLHYPLRAAVWEAYHHGRLPFWNPRAFSGMPLLASYRPGALYPPMAALALLPRFEAFQVLVAASLAAAGVMTFLLLRRLRTSIVGAYAGGLFYSLGPYLVGHLDDTPTVVAAPLLPLSLLAAEVWVDRHDRRAFGLLAAALALLLVAGSPEAARAGFALVAGRLAVAHVFRRQQPGPKLTWTLLAAGVALLLAAPQLLPTLDAARSAGPGVSGRAPLGDAMGLPGFTGLVLRYASHSPAPALALAATPLLISETPVLVSGVALLFCLGLQRGQGPLAAPGALALVFDLTLSVVAAFSLGAQWEARREARGRRLRSYFLFASLVSAAALSASAALLGPLPQALAGAVGVLALSLILYFANATSEDPVAAHLWLLPLTASFLLQPQGREVLADAPLRAELEQGTPTKLAVDHALGSQRGRILTLVRRWPRGAELDLAFPNIGALSGRSSASGYDPLAPQGPRSLLDDMTPYGALPGAFFRSDPLRLVSAGVRWLQIPSSSLLARGDRTGLGETFDLRVDAGRPRFLPTPVVATTEIHLASWLAEAVEVPQGAEVARVFVRIATGQEIELPVRAGVDTAEWAHDRPDVSPRVAHSRAEVLESFPAAGGSRGHHYRSTLAMPGRYFVGGLRIERLPGPGDLVVSRVALFDGVSRRSYPLALPAAFVSDTARFREVTATPAVRLFEVEPRPDIARVVGGVRVLDGETAVLEAVRAPTEAGIDPLTETAMEQLDARVLTLPSGSRPGPATLVGEPSNRIEVRAQGPGLLVLAETWDPGWRVRVDGERKHIVRVEHARMGVVAPAGIHRFEFDYRPPGFAPGLALAGVGLLVIAFARI